MKITKSQLKQIIKEELQAAQSQEVGSSYTTSEALDGLAKEYGHDNFVSMAKKMAEAIERIGKKLGLE